ncbi:hypothetical protein [Clostridium massiliamazoniense]|uniref:hypothetical protein n=1 Tax=Clostridium massiliamazoniense TaxID=1347366 RepID=UPI0006D850F8|nr:hypothetical protein [Clostridium massiliamazoniense]
MAFIKLLVGYMFIIIAALLNIIFLAPFAFLFNITDIRIILPIIGYFIAGLIPYMIGVIFLLFKGKKYVISILKVIIAIQIVIYVQCIYYVFIL